VKTTFDKEGHRGCRGLMPENTIPAMLKAIDLGVTTLEMDAVITKDSQVILSHEPFFNHEITTKHDGTAIPEAAERSYNIYQMSYAETQQYDVGLKPHPKFPRQQKLAATKPLLSTVIDSAEAYIKATHRPPVLYNIETKSQPLTDGIFHPDPETFVRLLMHVIEVKGITNRVIIQSFDVRTLQVLHKRYPKMMTSLLIEDYDKKTFQEQLQYLGFTPTVYSPHHSLVNATLVAQCHAAGVKLVPWTVNERQGIEDLKKLGVDGVITDYPDLFSQIR
jgi:glycerophosphoryl diester phosphodiesterase